MKKIIALLMTLALLISALALPAFAEEGNETVDQVTSATRETAQGGPNGQQPPEMPGNGQNNQNDQNSQQSPEMPGNEQNSQNDQNSQRPPEMPANGQNDGKGGKPQGGRGKKGSADRNAPGGEPEKLLDFEQLVKDNVISQEVCDAILNYMKEHAPQGQPDGTAPAEGRETGTRTGENAPAQGSEPPAKPEGDRNAPGGMEAQLLQELLDNSVITQEIYDLLLGMLTTTETTAETTADTAVAGA